MDTVQGRPIGIRWNWKIVLLMAALVITSAAASTASWKMLQFHSRLASIVENDQWEQQLTARGAFRNAQPILFFGDSEIARWPMAESFGELPIYNRGLNGNEVRDAMERYDEALRTTHPRLVIVEIGTNDLGHGRNLDETMGYIERILFKAPRAVVCALLPARGQYLSNHPIAQIRLWNARLKQLADKYGAQFVDFTPRLADEVGQFRDELTVDGLHPSAAGYAVMTRVIYPYLK